MTPGTALEIGMGQGRNTIAMARLGWEVTGIDNSDEGIRQALAEAKKHNVNIRAILAGADKFDYGSNRYHLIYATFEQQIFSDNADKMLIALKPGGLIITEGFQDDFSKEIARPLGYRLNELLRAFGKFRSFFTRTRLDLQIGTVESLRRLCGSSPVKSKNDHRLGSGVSSPQLLSCGGNFSRYFVNRKNAF